MLQNINVGTENVGDGLPLRNSFVIVNTNFSEVETASGLFYKTNNPNNFIRSGDVNTSLNGLISTGSADTRYFLTGVSGEFYPYRNPNSFVQSGQFISGISITGGLAIQNDLLISAGNNITLTQNGLHSVTIASTAAGGGGIFTGLSTTGFVAARTGAIALDFSSGVLQTLYITGNTTTRTTLSTTNRTAGQNMGIRVYYSGTTAAPSTPLIFNNSWNWLTTSYPTGLMFGSGKFSLLSLTCFGTGEGDILSVFAIQP